MSLINDVLKDLDQRQAQSQRVQTTSLPRDDGSGAPSSRRKYAVLLSGAAIVGLGLIAYGFLPQHPQPAPHKAMPRSPMTPGQPLTPARQAAPPIVSSQSVPPTPEIAPTTPPPAAATLHAPSSHAEKAVAAASSRQETFHTKKKAERKDHLDEVRNHAPRFPSRTPASLSGDHAASALPDATAPAVALPAVSMRPALPSPTARAQTLYASALENLKVDPVSAQTELEHALTLDPHLTNARSQLALLLWRQGHSQEALNLLREGRQLNPQNAELTILLARLLAGMQQNREALDLLNQLNTPPRGNAAYYGLLGGLARQQGQLDLAIRAYQNALQLAPTNPQWQIGLGLSLADRGRTAQARPFLLNAVKRLPPDSEMGRYLQERLAQLP